MATAKYFMEGPKAGQLITAFQQTNRAATEGNWFTISNEFDAAQKYEETVGGGNVATAGNGLDATDVAEVLAIPANTQVMRVYATVLTAEGATQVIDIGDGSDADGYFNDFDANAAANTTDASLQSLTEGTPNTFTGYSFGKFYTAADTIDITAVTNAYGVGKVRLTALCFSPVV